MIAIDRIAAVDSTPSVSISRKNIITPSVVIAQV
jgi:hypothetical protein